MRRSHRTPSTLGGMGVLVLAGCGVDGTGALDDPAPNDGRPGRVSCGTKLVRATPPTLSFGEVEVGARIERQLQVEHCRPGAEDVRLSFGAAVARCDADSNAPFCVARTDGGSIAADGALDIAPGETAQLTVVLVPPPRFLDAATSPLESQLGLSACPLEPECETLVPLRADVLGTDLVCEPTPVDFGEVRPSTARERRVWCRNAVGVPVEIERFELDGDGAFDFVDAPAPATLEAGAPPLEIDVRFSPTTLRESEATLTVRARARGLELTPRVVRLTGRGGGPILEVETPRLDFGRVSLLAPARQRFVITNAGFEELLVEDFRIEPNSVGFYTDDGADIIPAGASKAVAVDFQPRVLGLVEAELFFSTNDSAQPELRMDLTGFGINLPPCNYELSARSLSFGRVPLGEIATLDFEVRNLSQRADCLVNEVALRLESDLEYFLPDGRIPDALIEPGGAFVVPIGYRPESLGQHSGLLEFSVSNPDTPFQQVSLSGSGTSP